ncbi:hypothetical protein HKD37_03G007352 [Glycine soja]
MWILLSGKRTVPHRKKLKTYLGIVARNKFKYDLTSKWVLATNKDNVDDTVCKKYDISKEKWAQFCQSRRETLRGRMCEKRHRPSRNKTTPHVLSRGGYEYLENKLMEEKKKKQLDEAAKSRSTYTVIDPPSSIRRHVKWKMAHTKKIGQMTYEAAKEIANKIVSHIQL